MSARRTERLGVARPVHRHAWLWEPLADEPTFVLRAMFGAKAVYLHGRMVLCFCTGDEPWHGMLVCMEREQHSALLAEFPSLTPHAILPKWLYLSEAQDEFERIATALVKLVHARDPRIGITPRPRKHRSPRGPGRTRP